MVENTKREDVRYERKEEEVVEKQTVLLGNAPTGSLNFTQPCLIAIPILCCTPSICRWSDSQISVSVKPVSKLTFIILRIHDATPARIIMPS